MVQFYAIYSFWGNTTLFSKDVAIGKQVTDCSCKFKTIWTLSTNICVLKKY